VPLDSLERRAIQAMPSLFRVSKEKRETQAFLALQVCQDSKEDLVVMDLLVPQASEDHL
ncbi:hypothetical protein M9458_015655, partial [Cirrhinus mrigala]